MAFNVTATEHLDEAQAALDELRAAIAREHELLGGGDPEALEAVADTKRELIDRLGALDPATRSGLTPQAYEAAVIDSGDEATLARWRRFLDTLRAMRQENERNGIAIRRGLETVSAGMDILRGVAPSAGAATYGADGLSGGGSDRHLSTRA